MPAKQKNKKACKILGVICAVFCILVSQLLETPQDFPSIQKKTTKISATKTHISHNILQTSENCKGRRSTHLPRSFEASRKKSRPPSASAPPSPPLPAATNESMPDKVWRQKNRSTRSWSSQRPGQARPKAPSAGFQRSRWYKGTCGKAHGMRFMTHTSCNITIYRANRKIRIYILKTCQCAVINTDTLIYKVRTVKNVENSLHFAEFLDVAAISSWFANFAILHEQVDHPFAMSLALNLDVPKSRHTWGTPGLVGGPGQTLGTPAPFVITSPLTSTWNRDIKVAQKPKSSCFSFKFESWHRLNVLITALAIELLCQLH